MDNIRYRTKQEKLILSFFEANKGSGFSADEVFGNISAEGVSRATVYRRLERLVADGVLTKLQLPSGNCACYRLCENECKNSSHFVCTACNRIEHIDCHLIPELSEHFEKGHGVKIDSAKTVFYGLCERCVSNAK